MKRMRRVLLFSSAIWAFVAVAGVYSVYLSRGTPDWYRQQSLTVNQRQIDANESDQTFADFVSYINDLAAAQRRHARTGEVMSIGPKSVTLTESQINAFIEKWEQTLISTGVGLDRYLTGERVAFLEGRILLAATIRNESVLSNTIISAELGLSMDDQDRLAPSVIQYYGGRLPLPRILLASLERQLKAALERNIANWKADQHIWPDGLSDDNAAAAAWAGVLLAALDGEPTDATLLLPCNLGGLDRSVRVRLMDLHVADRQIHFTIRPLTDAERAVP